MGFEAELFAIPNDFQLLARARNDQLSGDTVQTAIFYLKDRRQTGRRCSEFAQGDPAYVQLVDELEDVLSLHPGMEHRHCELDRRFEWLAWTLRQFEQSSDGNFAKWAIQGCDVVADHIRSTQGIRIRWNDATLCRQIAIWISSIDPVQVLQVINPGQMLEVNLYKFPQNYENERLGESILSDLNALTKFYLEVSSRGEAVVIVID